MPKCIFYTYAYNAEKTIERTIQSVLTQTEPNFQYYVVDNGATDRTGEIIQKMARQDSRIIPLRNLENMVWESGNDWGHVAWQQDPNNIFCFLDADDTYKPDFLETMLGFMQEYQLDIAACGNDFVDKATGQTMGIRKLSANLILAGQGFSYYFPLYHQFMRTMWGKLYRISVLKQFQSMRAPALKYGWDTLFGAENFRNASRVGILAQSLHRYYIYKGSSSYQYDPDRLRSPEILYHSMERFLQDKCAEVTARNQDFLLSVYASDLEDALHVLWNASIPESETVSNLLILLDSRPLRLLIQRDDGRLPLEIREKRQWVFSNITDRMMAMEEVPDALVEQFCQFGELLCASIQASDKWLCFRQLHKQFLYDTGRTQEADKL